MPRSLAQLGASCLSAGVRVVIAGAAVVLAACGTTRGDEVPLEDVCLAAAPCADIGCYATFDTVFLQRSNWAVNQPLAVTGVGDTATPVISAQDMQFATQPGVRLIAGEIDPCGVGWEVGYLGVWGMFADATAQGPANIGVPDPLATLVPSLSNASVARTTYASTLNSAQHLQPLFRRRLQPGRRRTVATLQQLLRRLVRLAGRRPLGVARGVGRHLSLAGQSCRDD
jgi:hypothetical protein